MTFGNLCVHGYPDSRGCEACHELAAALGLCSCDLHVKQALPSVAARQSHKGETEA